MARQEKTAKVNAGDVAPEFELPAQTGESVRLSDLVARGPVVLYFYPKDNTAGCTAEACGFRDSYDVFREAGAQVVGVSSDSVVSHQRFATRHKLPFLLLSDQNGTVRQKYGVATTLGILPGRVTYIIDRRGIVRHAFSSQLQTSQHIKEALATIASIST